MTILADFPKIEIITNVTFLEDNVQGAVQSIRRSTTMVGYVLGVVSELERRGIQASEFLVSAGISNRLTNDPLNRIPGDSIARVLRLATRVSGEPDFGLTAARSMHPSNFHALGYGLLSSESLLSFCQRLVRFFPMISDCGRIEIEERDNCVVLLTRSFGPICAEIQANWQSFLLRTMRQVYGNDLEPLRVEFMHSKKRGVGKAYLDDFRAPLSFGHDRCAIIVSKEDAHRTLRNGSQELADLNDRGALKYISAINKDDIISKTQLAIVEDLEEHGYVSRESVSKKMRISVSQLHHRLTAKDTNFQTILDQTRFALAKDHVRNPKLSITEIGYMLGFTDSANFSRAFHRWSGTSPRAYRRNLGAGPTI